LKEAIDATLFRDDNYLNVFSEGCVAGWSSFFSFSSDARFTGDTHWIFRRLGLCMLEVLSTAAPDAKYSACSG